MFNGLLLPAGSINGKVVLKSPAGTWLWWQPTLPGWVMTVGVPGSIGGVDYFRLDPDPGGGYAFALGAAPGGTIA